MKKLVALLLAITLAGSVVLAVSIVAVIIQRTGEKPAQQPPVMTHVGEVVSVDRVHNQIVITSKTGQEMTVPIRADAKITMEGKLIRLALTQSGDKVIIQCDE